MENMETNEPADAVLDAIRKGDAKQLQALVQSNPSLADLRDPTGVSPLVLALYHGHPEIAGWLRERRTDLDIFEASALGDRDRVAALLASDDTLRTACSPDGFAALALASFFGRGSVVRLLLDAGADPNAVGHGAVKYTALTGAVTGRHADVVAMLLERGADANYRYGPGYTPLHAAAGGGSIEIVRLLLGAGADPMARTENGQQPRDVATQNGHAQLAALLGGESR